MRKLIPDTKIFAEVNLRLLCFFIFIINHVAHDMLNEETNQTAQPCDIQFAGESAKGHVSGN